MTKSEQFSNLLRHMAWCIGNQEIIKDEVVQECGERLMTFLMLNGEQLLRGLKMEELCYTPTPEILDSMAKKTEEIWMKNPKNDPTYILLMPHMFKIGHTVAGAMFGSLWEHVEKEAAPKT